MIDAMIRTKLLATSAVTALVSTRVYIDEQPDPATLPSITIHPISGVPDKTVAGSTLSRVQVSCWSLPGKPKNPKPKLYFVSVLTVFWGYFFTLTLQVIFLFPDFTVIVAVPFFFATIFPFEFTAATLELELL